MANVVSNSSSFTSHDGNHQSNCQTEWKPEKLDILHGVGQQQQQQQQNFTLPSYMYSEAEQSDHGFASFTGKAVSSLETSEANDVDHFDDLPLLRDCQNPDQLSNCDATVESLNSCPISDFLHVTDGYPGQSDYLDVKAEPSKSYIADAYNMVEPDKFTWGGKPTLPNIQPRSAHGHDGGFSTHQFNATSSSSINRFVGFYDQLDGQPMNTTLYSPYGHSHMLSGDFVASTGSQHDRLGYPHYHHHHHDGMNLVHNSEYNSPGYGYHSPVKQYFFPAQQRTIPPSSLSCSSNLQSPIALNSAESSFNTQYQAPPAHQHFVETTAATAAPPIMPCDSNSDSFVLQQQSRERSSTKGVAKNRRRVNNSKSSKAKRQKLTADEPLSPFSPSSSVGALSSWCASPFTVPVINKEGVAAKSSSGSNGALHDRALADLGSTSGYFWQYNTQSKQRSHSSCQQSKDPYLPDEEFHDPIFANNNSQDASESQEPTGLRHAGKLRRGDGTDTRPNPQLLLYIGNLLFQLNGEINSIQCRKLSSSPTATEDKIGSKIKDDNKASTSSNDSSTPTASTTTTMLSGRREKNMLASRVCRLKRKAQHEANKIVLAGLRQECECLLQSLAAVEQTLRQRLLADDSTTRSSQSMTTSLQQCVASFDTSNSRVAGRCSDFVAEVVRRVAAGDATGGLRQTVVSSSNSKFFKATDVDKVFDDDDDDDGDDNDDLKSIKLEKYRRKSTPAVYFLDAEKQNSTPTAKSRKRSAPVGGVANF